MSNDNISQTIMRGLGILDTRCFACFKTDGVNFENDEFKEMKYVGNGIFNCECGETLDLSKNTYKVRIEAKIDPDCYDDPKPWIEFSLIEPFDENIVDYYPKEQFNPEKKQEINKKSFLEDLQEYQEEWWDYSSGMFDLEIYYCWTKSGYYEVEWDLELTLLTRTPINDCSTSKEKS